jgi:hypothetical protein
MLAKCRLVRGPRCGGDSLQEFLPLGYPNVKTRFENRRGHVLAAADYEFLGPSQTGFRPGLRPSPRNFESFRDQRRISGPAIVDSKPPDFEN